MVNKSLILDRVKAYFRLKGNSQLAEFLGVTRQTISNWYSRNSIDYDIIIMKCTAIDESINLKWLLTGEPSIHGGEIHTEEHYSIEEEEEISKSVNYLTEEYERFKAFSEPLLIDCGYLDKALNTEQLYMAILNIYEYASEASVFCELRRLYEEIKRGETTEIEVKQKLTSLISQDKIFYNIVAPYRRELTALNALLKLNDIRE